MKALWLKYAARIDALTRRERLMVFGAAVAATVTVIYFIAIDPAQRRARALQGEMQNHRAEMAAFEKGGPPQADPNAANRTRVEALRKQIAMADATLKSMQRDLVPAGQVNSLLQEMVARDKGLTLVSLRTMPAEPLVPDGDKRGGAKAAAPSAKRDSEHGHVYKHGIEITVQGTYSSLHDYLARLERSPSRMYWWRVRLNAEEDARLTLTLTVYTLSLDKAWLQV